MNVNSPTPNQVSRFLPSDKNKRNLQNMCRDIVFCKVDSKPDIYVSSVVEEGEVFPALVSGGDDNMIE